MNIQQAYQTLDLPENATPEEAKKKFRQLSKQFHPDVNKSPDAEAKFKTINEAYQIVQSGKSTDPEPHHNYSSGAPFDINEIFSRIGVNFGGINNTHQRQYDISPIITNLTISFKEAVQGCKKEITYQRNEKCDNCQGDGELTLNNGCPKCQGKGRTTIQQGMSVFITTCPQCKGKTKTTTCGTCDGEGCKSERKTITLSIPSRVSNNQVLRVQGMGHYGGSNNFGDQYGHGEIHLTVIPQDNLTLEDKDVVSTLSISMLDALKGSSEKVPTIDGKTKISIPEKTKNRDEITIMTGDRKDVKHRIIVNVLYPDNVDQIIEMLENSNAGKVRG